MPCMLYNDPKYWSLVSVETGVVFTFESIQIKTKSKCSHTRNDT